MQVGERYDISKLDLGSDSGSVGEVVAVRPDEWSYPVGLDLEIQGWCDVKVGRYIYTLGIDSFLADCELAE